MRHYQQANVSLNVDFLDITDKSVSKSAQSIRNFVCHPFSTPVFPCTLVSIILKCLFYIFKILVYITKKNKINIFMVYLSLTHSLSLSISLSHSLSLSLSALCLFVSLSLSLPLTFSHTHILFPISPSLLSPM